MKHNLSLSEQNMGSASPIPGSFPDFKALPSSHPKPTLHLPGTCPDDSGPIKQVFLYACPAGASVLLGDNDSSVLAYGVRLCS